MKYKVGDKVRIVSKKPGVGWNGEGEMDKWLGKTMTIRRASHMGCFDFYRMVEDQNEWFGGWTWYEWMIEGLAPEQPEHKIVITTDGKTTLAWLYDGKKVIKRAAAKCSPNDEFDFTIGAKLAFERLMDRGVKKEKPTPEVPEGYNGKVLCIESDLELAWTVGKIYEVVDGVITDNKGNEWLNHKKPFATAEDFFCAYFSVTWIPLEEED